MTVQDRVDAYIAGQPPAKAADMRELHRRLLAVAPGCELWFLDGRDGGGKIVSNPNIGYGRQTTRYANGETRDFYRIGVSANTSGISVYLMGIDDRAWLAKTYGERLGKAKITGYCVKFKGLKDLDLAVLEEMFANHLSEER